MIVKINSRKVIKVLETFAPERHAQSWDNVGFQIGNIDSKIDKVMIALEVTPEVIDEAIDQSVDLLIVHHPLVFKPIKSVVNCDPIGNMILNLVSNRINLIVAHTNLDASDIGLNHYLAKKINLNRVCNLDDAYVNKYYKVAFYIPVEYRNKMINILDQLGAGALGKYEGCTYTVEGKGTFKPLEGANPFIGSVDTLEEIDEVKIETVVEEGILDKVIEKIIKNHPYEMPAYDVIALENQFDNPNMGLVGYLDSSVTLENFTMNLKETLGSESIRIVKANDRKINKVALCTGASSDLIENASKAGVDVYITGDLKYHEAQYAKLKGLNIIDAGHFETEQIFVDEFVKILKREFEKQSYDVVIIKSEININPFTHL